MSKRFMLLVVVMMVLAQGSCHKESSKRSFSSEMSEYSGKGFALLRPPGVDITMETPVGDFHLYRFWLDGQIFLTAYLGNHPDFVYTGPTIRRKSQGEINGLPFARTSVQDAEGVARTEVLIRLSAHRFWPAYIHFLYPDLPPSLQRTAERIIGSVQYQEAGGIHHPMENVSGDTEPFPPSKPTLDDVEMKIQELEERFKAKEDSGTEIDEKAKNQLELLRQQVRSLKEIKEGAKSGQTPN